MKIFRKRKEKVEAPQNLKPIGFTREFDEKFNQRVCDGVIKDILHYMETNGFSDENIAHSANEE